MSLGEARRQGKGLRLKLRIQPSELAVLPWEFLYDVGRDRYPCLSSNTPLVRYLDLPQPVEPLRVSPPLRVLGMVTSPLGLGPLDVEHEKRLVEEATSGLREGGSLELTWLGGETWRHLQRAMRQGPWHVFHFIGHGGFDAATEEGALALSNDAGRMHLLRARGLAELLDDHYPLRLVFLNSCEGARGSESDAFSSTAATLVRCGVPAVVAMQYEITDGAAIEFSRDFYEALADGLPVDAAVTEARTAVSMDSMLEWGTPVLYMHSPDGRVFEVLPAAARLPTSQEPGDLREDPLRMYREGVKSAWAGGELHERDAQRLQELANELQLSASTAAEIEREVMGEAVEALLVQARQRESAEGGGQSDTGERSEVQEAAGSPDRSEGVQPNRTTVTVSQPPSILGANWWALALAGVISGFHGLLASFLPFEPLGVLLVLASLNVATGVFVFVASSTANPALLLKIQGVIGVVAGLVIAISDLTDFQNGRGDSYTSVLLLICLGTIQTIVAIRLWYASTVMWLLLMSGALSVVGGIHLLLLVYSAERFGNIIWVTNTPRWLGIWGLAGGILLVAFALSVRNAEKNVVEG
jgi:CHAT domain-containing protein